MNVELLRKIQQRIVDAPRNFDMDSWFNSIRDDSDEICGTTACIAGEAILMAGAGTDTVNYFFRVTPKLQQTISCLGLDEARYSEGVHRGHAITFPEFLGADLLGIDQDEARKLFHVCFWPLDFQREYNSARFQDRAEVASRRIDHFIATGGAE